MEWWEKQIDREECEEDGLVTTMNTIKNCHVRECSKNPNPENEDM